MSRSMQRLIPIFLILSFSIFLAMMYLFFNTTNAYTLKGDAFQVVVGVELNYEEGLKFIYDETGPTYDGAELYEYLDSSPIYMVEDQYMVMPEYTIYVNPRGINYYQIPCFTEVNYESSITINEVGVSGGFIFDGKNTYTFLEDMTVRVNGEDIEVGKLSTISLATNEIYSLHNTLDESIIVDAIITGTLEATCVDYSVDLLSDILYTSNNEKILLFDEPELLDVIK